VQGLATRPTMVRNSGVRRSAALPTTARRIRSVGGALLRLISGASIRRRQAERARCRAFQVSYRSIIAPRPEERLAGAQRALIVGRVGQTGEGQAMLARLLSLAGYAPAVLLTPDERFLRPYYELAGVKEIRAWRPEAKSGRFLAAARTLLSSCHSTQDVLGLEHEGVRVGRSAASRTMRESQLGLLEAGAGSRNDPLVGGLAAALAATDAARQVLDEIRPALVVSYEMEYTPKREIFDACLATGSQVVVLCRAPRRDAVIPKRYTLANRAQHPSSLSDASWERLRRMPWTEDKRQELRQEWQQRYAAGDWWEIPSAQLSRPVLPAEEAREKLGIDSRKKTAVVFPHVPWDASFSWGEDLFVDYQEWLLETLRTACRNPNVNWVVKVHPANVGKSVRFRDGTTTVETEAIRRHVGALPPNFVVLPPDSDIGTLSLFGVMDFCLTVRGTVGIEAASLGIPVLTGGTGRYDRRGFTIDSTSTEQYLKRLLRIHEIPRLTVPEQELAQRFAYGMFLLRPLGIETAILGTLDRARRTGTLAGALEPALSAFLDWLHDPSAEDFLNPGTPHTQPLPGSATFGERQAAPRPDA
jgi:hypothetical protein